MMNLDEEDALVFADEGAEDKADKALAPAPWTVLIVDDDPEVHAITRVVLGDVVFEQRSIRFLSAYSAAEAQGVLAATNDIAAILLDVVMETDDAGLRLVRYIRHDLQNQQVRIILRTGQPGQAPEREVIVNYDINDYKAKSELTSQKLFTATVAALRSYQHIATIDQSRRGLEKIVDGSTSLLEQRSLQNFIQGVLLQMGSLLKSAQGSFLCTVSEAAAENAVAGLPVAGLPVAGLKVLAGSGAFEAAAGKPVAEVVNREIADDIAAALSRQAAVFRDRHCVIGFRSREHAASVIYVEGGGPLSPVDRQLIEIFCGKVAVGFDNVLLHERLGLTQRATVHALGKLAEYKDEVTGDHVRRLGRWSRLIAEELRRRDVAPDILTDEFLERIELASMLHDVGKVAIPDAILKKPGILDDDEMAQMRTHAEIGGRILIEAAGLAGGHSYLSMGADIALSHHERFDGAGYPYGLAGEAIPLAGRIVAVADVYDALLHARPYKPAWSRSDVVALLQREAGRHFDPAVVDALLTVLKQETAV
jgi:response regulator RpfG family c-di-GMP phosphodiesterase